MNLGTAVTLLIVGVILFFAVRGTVRTFRGEGSSSCHDCGGCGQASSAHCASCEPAKEVLRKAEDALPKEAMR